MSKRQMVLEVDRDLPRECAYVDFLLASSLKNGCCAPILRTLMVSFAAGISQRVEERDYIFEPEAICKAIKVLEGAHTSDYTKGPFRYEQGPLLGLYKKHFFQASFLAQNTMLEIDREGAAIIYRKLSEYYGRGDYIGQPMDEIDVHLIAEAFSRDTIERRAARRLKGPKGGLTGEHLIYAAFSSGNIYLYVSYHGEDPQRILDCVAVSFQDFPELAGVAPVFGASKGPPPTCQAD